MHKFVTQITTRNPIHQQVYGDAYYYELHEAVWYNGVTQRGHSMWRLIGLPLKNRTREVQTRLIKILNEEFH